MAKKQKGRVDGLRHAALMRLVYGLCREKGVALAPGRKIHEYVLELGAPVSCRNQAWNWLAHEFRRQQEQRSTAAFRALLSTAKYDGCATATRAPAAKPPAPKPKPPKPTVTQTGPKPKPDQRKDFYYSEEWRRLRFRVLKASNGACTLCGRSHREHGVTLHVDHIKPRSKFPKLELEFSNLQVLCEDCNLGKSNKDDTDWRVSTKLDRMFDDVDWKTV